MTVPLPEGDRQAHAHLLYERLLKMSIGALHPNPRQTKYQMPVLWDFDIYRDHKGWTLYWHEPRPDSLGLTIPDEKMLLRVCLNDFDGTDFDALWLRPEMMPE